MNERKMVSRSVAITLGLICIVLIALIAYFTVIGISAQNSYNNLQNQNKQLQTWLAGNITSFETQISSLNANITNLETWLSGNITAYNNYVGEHSHTNVEYQNLEQQITNLQSILDSNDSIVWVNNETISQTASNYTSWYEYAYWAGYVSIYVSTANSSLSYANIVYSFHGVYQYNSRPLNYGPSGTAIFLVPSFSYVYIEVGNNNLVDGATETVTITYYY